MQDFASPAALKAGADAIERGYEQFVAVTRERLEAVYPAAAEGFDQVAGLQKRCVDGVLNASRATSDGWAELGAKLSADTMAAMDAFFSLPRSWFGGGLFAEMEASLISLSERTARDLTAMEQNVADLGKQQAEAVKAAVSEATMAATAIGTEQAEALRSATAGAKDGIAAAKAEALDATKAVVALGETLDARLAAQRTELDAHIAQTAQTVDTKIDTKIDEARSEMERETDEEVADKLNALKRDFDARLKAVEASAAAEVQKLRAEFAALATAQAQTKSTAPASGKVAAKPAAAKQKVVKSKTKKSKAAKTAGKAKA